MSVAIASSYSNHMGEPWRAATSQRVLSQYCPLPVGYPSAQRSEHPASPASTAVGYSQRPPRLISRSHPSRTVLHGWHQVAFMFPDVYDSDDALNRSPRLQPSVVNYGPDVSIPPFLQEKQKRASANGKRDSSSSPTSSEADVVLLGTLAPDRPDIAREVGEGSPPIDSESEDDSRTRVAHISSKSNETQVVAAKTALGLMTEEPKRNHTSLPSIHQLVSQDPILAEPPFAVRQTSPPRSLQPLGRPRQDSLATSNVGKYTIPPPNNLDFPALQAPTPSAASSPEHSQSLPSIGQALASLDSGAASTPFAPTPTPQLSRGPSTLSTISTGPTLETSFAPSQMPTPYSHPSPMSLKDLSATSPLSQPQYAMHPPSLTPDTSNMTAYSEASLRGAPVGRSPTHGYPTPTEVRAAGEEHPDVLISGPSMYKCSYPGCTAGAFQTQYLLNSHANVHSQDRPHFCPVAGCPRGIGGKGFKRKNEMIRHGLVHDSPGYVCPFCTDQQHKYPRPDNLQRHVRVHHVDKDKDDPLLRDVLAQRPKGSGRGRRRRGHS
ncbi:hypothetical protein EYB26_008568 [Talaromyces marneffei]|uniref:uncharacterized protein n=1 Tax=Talaromyces marneffei TaxID=37727 RepID=UPI0012A978D9|nr:uncharacterized protein EYB26_008568 [Talaromyces marneffei]QGA20858.1 hypothetical protein EYB26_008568 [Talaromyces marneffei]